MPPVKKRRRASDTLNLNCYTIRFHEKGNAERKTLDEVFDGKDFPAIMKRFNTFLRKTVYTNDSRDRLLYLHEVVVKTDEVFAAILKKGHNGQETDIDELEEGIPTTVSSVKADQFNCMYFYFMIAKPPQAKDKLFFVSQSQGKFGFKDVFAEYFKKFMEINLDGKYTSEINPLTVPSLFAKYLKDGDVRKLRFIKHSLTENAENILGERDDPNADSYEITTSIKAKRKGFTGIKDADFENSSFVEIYSDLGIDFDDVYAEVSIGGRMRTLPLTKPDSFCASFDITDEVPLQPDTKKPDFEVLHEVAIDILENEILNL
jgi:hypothetical protein